MVDVAAPGTGLGRPVLDERREPLHVGCDPAVEQTECVGDVVEPTVGIDVDVRP